MDEHAILSRWLRPLAAGFAPARGLLDDAAVLEGGGPLAVSADTLVEGVHFPDGLLAPDQIARRALRANLSDLAAAGAAPLCYLLALQLPPGADEAWMEAFAAGLEQDQRHFGLRLAGGDTVRTPGPLALSVTVVGRPAHASALARSGARAGDVLMVTGTIGDAWLGRRQLEGDLPRPHAPHLADRFLLPAPRIETGLKLAGLARAAVDVSDGLVADLRNLCAAAGTGAEIRLDAVPLSGPARELVDAGAAALADLVTGGDDYELLVSLPPGRVPEAAAVAADTGVALTAVGEVTDTGEVAVLGPDGEPMEIPDGGHLHAWPGAS